MMVSGAIAIIAAAALFSIVNRYPLPLAWKLAPLLCYAVLLWLKPEAWLLVLPIALPVLDLTPWTGWIFVDTFDLIVLTTVAVGYLRLSGSSPTRQIPRAGWALLGLFLISVLISTWRGLGATGLPALDPNALSNYASPYNALHVAKGFVSAILLAPLLTRTAGQDGVNLVRYFLPGILLGLAFVCAVAIWERAAFPGLMNFSQDYRTTASFSAMHTGGAALDGFLALSLPMVILLLLPGRTVLVNALGLLLVAAGIYVLATTFSRGLYAGCGLSVLILLVSLARAGRVDPVPRKSHGHTILLITIVALLVWTLYRLFGSGGYRALAAALVFLLAASYVGAQIRPEGQRWNWQVLALVLVLISMALARLVPKGAYVAFAIAALTLVLAATVHLSRPGSRVRLFKWLWAGIVWLGAATLLVALYWGGAKALVDALSVVALAFLACTINRQKVNALWHFSKRTALLVLGSAAVLGLAIPVVGNYYAQARFARVEGDLADRFAHWSDVLAIMNQDGQTTLFGMGSGRFYSEYFWRNNRNEMPGSFQYMNEAGNQFLRLAGPRYQIGYGEVLRFGQRIAITPGERYRLSFSYRTPARDAMLETYLCEKLLLYFRTCSVKNVVLKEADGTWHEASTELSAGSMGTEPWYLRRPVQFSVANPGAAVAVDVDNFQLIDSHGNEVLKNGKFTHGNDFWFYSSDRYHLPWHAKNLFLNVYFDQGLLGVTVLVALVGYVLIRLVRRVAAGNHFAVVLLASISGFLVVGIFDSLLDVPRIATLFFLILCMALQTVARRRLHDPRAVMQKTDE